MDVIFTTHARERMAQRAITEAMVRQVVRKPDSTAPEADGDTKFIGKVNGVKVFVICKPLPDQGAWLVKSTWIRGEGDDRRPARRAAAPRLRIAWVAAIGLLVLLILFYIATR